ncbi:MAG: type II secretion system protein [bacterium]
MKNNKGFTIVELLVVLAIIGVLVGLSIVGIQQVQKTTRVTKANNGALLLKAQLTSYYNEFRHYPIFGTSIKIDTTSDPMGEIVYLCNDPVTDCSSSTSADVFSVSKIDLLGLSSITSYNSTAGAQIACTSAKLNCESDSVSGAVSAESWKLYYVPDDTSSTRPQKFFLATCTEAGWNDFSENPLPDSSALCVNNNHGGPVRP